MLGATLLGTASAVDRSLAVIRFGDLTLVSVHFDLSRQDPGLGLNFSRKRILTEQTPPSTLPKQPPKALPDQHFHVRLHEG